MTGVRVPSLKHIPIPSLKRLPILSVIFAVLLLVSVVPLLIYGWIVIGKNREALKTNEQELQNAITWSVAEEIKLYESSLRQQLRTLLKMLEPAHPEAAAWDSPYIRSTLEQFIASNQNLLYVTLLDERARGIKAGRYDADRDRFLGKALERAFTAAQQNQSMKGEPVLVLRSGMQVPVMVDSLPVVRTQRFRGMLAAVVDLQPLVERLKDSSGHGLEVFVVNSEGRLMLHHDLSEHTIGQDMSELPIVEDFLREDAPARGPTSEYEISKDEEKVPMLGTYSAVPSLRWAVIAQKPQRVAYYSASEMVRVTTLWGIGALLVSLVVAYFSALRITTPINVLTRSSRAIARGDFSQRIQLESRTEIGELAATFNQMTAELEQYVGQLKRAAEENHDLFLSSIRTIAAAVDEKDPYTHGHAERVTRYSVLIGTQMGLSEEELYKIKISGLLHDVGKIGIEDRILKKPGALTPEEFEIMKQHTSKGAVILRPIEKLQEMIPGVELHHESLDGRGYPQGLKGDQIPLLARIISVADTFDAMTTHRPYQAAMQPEVALKYILSQANKRFDPRCAEALQQLVESGQLRATRAALVV